MREYEAFRRTRNNFFVDAKSQLGKSIISPANATNKKLLNVKKDEE